MALAALWENYQDELFLLSFRNGMIEMLENYESVSGIINTTAQQLIRT
jgi:hypothetical protein